MTDAMSDAALAEHADENFVTHASWAAGRLSGARTRIGDDLVLVDSGLPCDTFNFALRARLAGPNAATTVRGALGFFQETGNPFSWWVGPADTPRDLGRLLEAEGLSAAESELAMAAPLATLPACEAPAEVSITRVTTAADLAAFARVNAANWSPPDEQVERFYRMAAPLLLAPDAPQRFYIARVDGTAVGAAEVTVTGRTAGVYGVSTLAAYRRRGIGSAVTHAALADARGSGCSIGVLQASADGVGIYARLGFSAYGEVCEYKP